MFCKPHTQATQNIRPAFWLATWFLLCAVSFAAVTTPDASLSDALRSLTQRAATIITGRVTDITREGDVVTITLTVEETLKGTPAATVTLHEWAGLWPPGQSRYELGQRATFFLQAPGRSGLASPVDGSEGVVPIVQQSADEPVMLDVRRLAARLERTVGTPLPSFDESAITLADAKKVIAQANAPVTHVPIIRRPLPGVLRPLPPRVLLQRPFEVEGLSK